MSNRIIECPSCSSRELLGSRRIEAFEYDDLGTVVVLHAEVEVFSCGACVLEFTDAVAESARNVAVAKYLDSAAQNKIKQAPRKRLADLLDPTNFLGTGLTTREFVQLGHAEKLAASWTNQPREERKRRLNAIMHLSVELARVRETTAFSTRLAESAIEAVIEGDWKMVEEWAGHFTFNDESVELRQKYAPIFSTFRELLLQALRATELPT